MRYLILVLCLFLTGVAMAEDGSKNVLGGPLAPNHGSSPTGFYRDGYCRTDARDTEQHAVAARVTDAFLAYTRSRGNDLQTPRPEYGFPGLKAGDNWCLCTARWKEAEQAGVAPPVNLAATHAAVLQSVPLETLKKYENKQSGGN